MFDDIDVSILNIIQENARVTNADIARQLQMAPSAILERVRKLEARGVIAGYECRLSPKALHLGLLAFVFVRVDEGVGSGNTGKLLAKVPEVQEVHHVAGEDCYLVKVRAESTEDFARILQERFGKIPGVRSTKSTIVLNTVKESGVLPLTQLRSRKDGE